MIVKTAEFVTSAVKPAQYPPLNLPEIAFAGRSNVGKSSLINTLVNRKRLVKTSGTPGRTQLINFFSINQAFAFVDLPGYGYARVPKKIKANWGPMIETYLSTRNELSGVVLIMDIRRVPNHEEINFIGWLKHYRIPEILIITKIDKLSKNKQVGQLKKITQALYVEKNVPILFSATTRHGKDNVWAAIENLVGT